MNIEQALEIIGTTKEEYEAECGSTEPVDLLLKNIELMRRHCKLVVSNHDLSDKYDKLVVSNHDLSDKYDKLVEQSNLERERAKSQIEHLQFIINSIYNRTLELNEKMQNGIITNQQLIEEITWLINHISCMYKFNEDAIKH